MSPRDGLEESQNDRTQLNIRVGNIEDDVSKLREVVSVDHDELTALKTVVEEQAKQRERGGERMWSVILIGIGIVVQIVGALVTMLSKGGK